MPEPTPFERRMRQLDDYLERAERQAAGGKKGGTPKAKPAIKTGKAGPTGLDRPTVVSLKDLDAEQAWHYHQAVLQVKRWQKVRMPEQDHAEALDTCGLPEPVTRHLKTHRIQTVGHLKFADLDAIKRSLLQGLAQNRFSQSDLMRFHRGLGLLIQRNVAAGNWKEN